MPSCLNRGRFSIRLDLRESFLRLDLQRLKYVSSTANPQIKRAVGLYDRKTCEQEGVFLVDGERLFCDGLESAQRFESVFLLEKHLDAYQDGLAYLAHGGADIFIVSDAVMAKLSATKNPQGIFAIAIREPREIPLDSTLLLILDGVSDPGNAGTLLRAAEAAGAEGVIFTPSSVDPYHEKVVRSAMGAHFRLPIWRNLTVAEFKKHFSDHSLFLADLSGETSYAEVDWQQKSTLIVGGEANGAGAEARLLATPIYIDMHGKTESLNAGIAGAVILFEAARQRRFSGALKT